MPTALILGASRGIGHEFVRQLLADRWRVIATARSDSALSELKQMGAEAFTLDVAQADSLAGLGWQLDGEKLDLAIYVAGVMGSIASTESSYGWLYRVSKSGLNMAVRCATFDYPKATFAVVHPGWVQTDMGGAGAAIKADESVSGLLRVIDSLQPGDSGSYRDYSGKKLPW